MYLGCGIGQQKPWALFSGGHRLPSAPPPQKMSAKCVLCWLIQVRKHALFRLSEPEKCAVSPWQSTLHWLADQGSEQPFLPLPLFGFSPAEAAGEKVSEAPCLPGSSRQDNRQAAAEAPHTHPGWNQGGTGFRHLMS